MAASRARAMRWSVGCWWKRRGIINIARASVLLWRDGAQDNRRASLRLRIRRNSGCVDASANWRQNTNPRPKIAVAIARELRGLPVGGAAAASATATT